MLYDLLVVVFGHCALATATPRPYKRVLRQCGAVDPLGARIEEQAVGQLETAAHHAKLPFSAVVYINDWLDGAGCDVVPGFQVRVPIR